MSQEQVLRAWLGGFPAAVLKIDGDGVITDSNGLLEKRLGRDVLGVAFLDLLDATSRSKWTRAVSEAGAERKRVELVLVGRDSLELRSFVVVPDAGPAGGHWVLEYEPDPDLERWLEEISALNSELVAAHRELAKERARLSATLDELRGVMESRARLVRGFTHDLKNPLGAARGMLRLLEDGVLDPLSERQREGVARARRSVDGALQLIEDLIEVARDETGRLSIAVSPVAVDRLGAEMIAEYRALAEAKGLALVLDVPDPPPPIHSDAGRVRQILGNLLSNAIKYTDRGEVRLVIRVEEKGPDTARCVALSVKDTGVGVPPEDQERVFGEFTRLGGSSEPGLGLGLAISRRLALALDGSVTVSSESGRGSTFTLWLPLRAADQGVGPPV